jgi:predicted nucleotidyltransferase
MGIDDGACDLIEGDYVETAEGLLFAVKGLHHPEGLVTAYLRYVPDPQGGRLRGALRYRRVYDLDETDELLSERYPRYLNYVERKGLTLQSVPMESISRTYSARERLKTVMEEPGTELETTIARFVTALSSDSGVPLNGFGVSGSVLIGLTVPTSDVDLIVYGLDAGHEVYSSLEELRASQDWIRQYVSETVRGVMENRWGDTDLDPEKMVDIETRKVLHGMVDGRDYFVRLVRKPKEFERETTSTPLRRAVLRATIADAKESVFTPCTYHVEDCIYLDGTSGPKVTQLVSYRGKFTEQASEGDIVEARGTVEEATYREGTIFRLMMGGRGDYLFPKHASDR